MFRVRFSIILCNTPHLYVMFNGNFVLSCQMQDAEVLVLTKCDVLLHRVVVLLVAAMYHASRIAVGSLRLHLTLCLSTTTTNGSIAVTGGLRRGSLVRKAVNPIIQKRAPKFKRIVVRLSGIILRPEKGITPVEIVILALRFRASLTMAAATLSKLTKLIRKLAN